MFYSAWMHFFCEVSKKAIKPSVAYIAKSARSQIGDCRIFFSSRNVVKGCIRETNGIAK